MSNQLRHDAVHLKNHKYIAHQIALLYQCLNQCGNLNFKKRVEQKFDEVKVLTEAEKVPQLSLAQQDWLVKLTTDIINEVSSLNYFSKKLEPAISFLKS